MTKPPQARNAIWRALLHVIGVRFSDGYKVRCRRFFSNRCAYCNRLIALKSRNRQFDHAVALARETDAFHLVYACGTCNGDEKREKVWQAFLLEKCRTNGKLFTLRKRRIEMWFATEPPVLISAADRLQLQHARDVALQSFNSAVKRLRKHVDSTAVS